MNIFDVVIILMIAMFGVVGLKRGVLKELVVTVGSFLVFFLAFALKDVLASFFCQHFPFLHFTKSLGGVSSLSIVFYQLIAFLLLVIIFQMILRILIKVSGFIGKVIDATIILALPNKLLGFCVGIIEGYLVVFLALNILAIPLHGNELFKESKVRDYIMNDSIFLSDHFGGMNYALDDILTMDSKDTNTNDLKVIDTLLKYKVVSVDFLEQLKENNRLSDIQGIDEILDHYK